MLYDLFADFYEKSSDRHPMYIVLMGTYNENTFDEMKILGFQEDSEANASFQDYVMDGADENFLQEYTKDGYQSEMLDVLYSDVNYEKIQVRALADEALDDEGRHAPRGVVMGDMFVHFTESDPMTPVWFEKLNPESPLDTIPVFQIPMRTVKRRLKVITLMDAMFKLLKMNEEKHWTEELLREFFAAGIDEALEIITYEFRGQKDIDGNPAILHPLTVGLMGVNDCICLKKVDSQKKSIIMTPHTEFQKKYYQQVIEIHQKTGFSPRKIAKLQLVPVSVRQMYHWIAIFEAENGKGSPRRIMEAKKSKEQEELESLKSRISELEESLRLERLRNRLNEKIIDIAEARWHIEIRKKAGTKR